MQSGQSVCQYRVCDSRLYSSMAIGCQYGVGVIVAYVAAWLSGLVAVHVSVRGL